MSFAFVRRYVQRHGRSDTFTALLSTHSHAATTLVKKPVLLAELDALVPPSPAEGLAERVRQMSLDPSILGQRAVDLVGREPSPPPAAEQAASFGELVRLAGLAERLAALGITEPTPIQQLLLRKLAGCRDDLLIRAQTGTGKSFGYLLALLDRRPIHRSGSDSLEATHLVLVPSSLVAAQLVAWAAALAPGTSIRVALSDGDSLPSTDGLDGSPATSSTGSSPAASVTEPGPSHILVATPKGLNLRLAAGRLSLKSLKTVVVDEADYLLKPLPRHATLKERQNRLKHPNPAMTALCTVRDYFDARPGLHRPRIVALSATLGGRTRDLLRHVGLVARDALFLEDQAARDLCPPQLLHHHRLLQQADDPEELARVVYWLHQQHDGRQGAVFVGADKSKTHLRTWLESLGLSVSLLSERAGEHADLLLGSDADARGLDHPGLAFVVLVDGAASATDYLHMAGRVGRAGRGGTVYSLLRTPTAYEDHIGYLGRLRVRSQPIVL